MLSSSPRVDRDPRPVSSGVATRWGAKGTVDCVVTTGEDCASTETRPVIGGCVLAVECKS